MSQAAQITNRVVKKCVCTPSQQKDARAARDAERKMENDYNGLLWNDYMNCDSCGAQDLWAAEREKLEAVQAESASSEKSATAQQIAGGKKHDLLSQNTGKQRTAAEVVGDEVYEDARGKFIVSIGSAEN